jgi:RHS repeat-associated protein
MLKKESIHQRAACTPKVHKLYDSLGRRIQKQVSDNSALNDPLKSFTRRYAYDNSELLFEFDGDNNLLAKYTNSNLISDDALSVYITPTGVAAKLAQTQGSFLFLKDQMGSIVDITNSNGTRLQHYIYSVYGIILGIQDPSSNDISSNPILATSKAYVGKEFDVETGYYYNRARYYDPSIGRFTSKDPIGFSAGSINQYAYASNNPAVFTDPTGNDSQFYMVNDLSHFFVVVTDPNPSTNNPSGKIRIDFEPKYDGSSWSGLALVMTGVTVDGNIKIRNFEASNDSTPLFTIHQSVGSDHSLLNMARADQQSTADHTLNYNLYNIGALNGNPNVVSTQCYTYSLGLIFGNVINNLSSGGGFSLTLGFSF